MIRYRVSQDLGERLVTGYDDIMIEYFGEHYNGADAVVPDGLLPEDEFDRDILPALDDFDKAYWISSGYATVP